MRCLGVIKSLCLNLLSFLFDHCDVLMVIESTCLNLLIIALYLLDVWNFSLRLCSVSPWITLRMLGWKRRGSEGDAGGDRRAERSENTEGIKVKFAYLSILSVWRLEFFFSISFVSSMYYDENAGQKEAQKEEDELKDLKTVSLVFGVILLVSLLLHCISPWMLGGRGRRRRRWRKANGKIWKYRGNKS